MTFLADVGARARGLAAHLLPAGAIEELARAGDRTSFASTLEEHGYPLADETGGAPADTAASVDAAIGRGGARRLAVLARWLGDRGAGFAAVLEADDRRLLRILLRAAAAGSPAVGIRPTALHPRRTLESLVVAGDPRDLVRRLARAGSPYAAPLEQAAEEADADLLALETALDRAFAQRACRGAAWVGGRLREWVAEEIDLENAWHALLGGTGSFVGGGRVLTAERHDAVLREPDAPARRRRLAETFADGPLGAVLADAEAGTAVLEWRVRAARIEAERRRARLDPLGAAPILEYVMRLRAELAGLRRILWGVAQGVSAETLLDETFPDAGRPARSPRRGMPA